MTAALSLLAAAADVSAGWSAHAERHDRDTSFAGDNLAAAWAAGLGNLCLYADLRTTARAIRTLAAGDASSALVFANHLIVLKAATVPASVWSDAARWAVVEGSHGELALAGYPQQEAEIATPFPGEDARTRAEAVRGGWRLSGYRCRCPGSVALAWLVVSATTGDGDVGLFLVPADAWGVEFRALRDHVGLRASASHDVLLRNVEVPDEHAFGLRPAGSARVPDALLAAWSAALRIAVLLGVGDAARDGFVARLHDPRRAAALAREYAAAGEVEARLCAVSALVDALASQVEHGAADARAAVLAEVVATREVTAAVQRSVTGAGGRVLRPGPPLERHLRDVLSLRSHAVQAEPALVAAGRAALSLDPRG